MFKEGDEFDGFTLLKYCGSGGYGSVFYCRDISGKNMAVKIISKKQIGESWKQELRGVSNYQKITENATELLQIFHVKSTEEFFYYTMEPADSILTEVYLPDTLAARLKNGPLPQNELWSVLSQTFKAIKLIHDKGFTHRDIKPENILFIKGKPKLADIGLFSSLSVTVTKLAGTLDYIPPEVRSSPKMLDSTDRGTRQRNDLYAFGMVIYCAISGMDPEKFPSLPTNLELTPLIKHFWHLSKSLCNRDLQQRIVSLEDLQKEFRHIDRSLQYGEDWLLEGNHIFDQFSRFLKSIFFRMGIWLSKYAWIVFLLIIITVYLSSR